MTTTKLSRSRTLRWSVPFVAVAAIAIGVGIVTTSAGAAPALPARSAADLLAALDKASTQSFSGTVVETARLGIPDLPGSGSSSSLSLEALVTGSHTARVWYGSPSQVRVALVGNLSESDVIRNGTDLWIWSSSDNTAEHRVLKDDSLAAAGEATVLPVDPRTAAADALAAIDPTTKVSVDGTSEVAGRPAYELVLSPRSSDSLIGQVRLALDRTTSVPLRVQVFAKGGTQPAFETGFTSVQFQAPDRSVFVFTPPPGAKINPSGATRLTKPALAGSTSTALGRVKQSSKAAAAAQGQPGSSEPTVIGSGWTAVIRTDGVTSGVLDQAGTSSGGPALGALLRATTTVTGSFGTAQLLRTPLLSVLLLPDGRVFAGAVEPSLLESIAGSAAGAKK